jgi:hypothetical protein
MRVSFVAIALAVAEVFVNFDRGESISHEVDVATEPNWSP